MCRPPIDSKCSVLYWQSIIKPPSASIFLANPINATFDALGFNENMLSPQKHLFTRTP